MIYIFFIIQENIRRSREQLERSQSASAVSSPQGIHHPPLTEDASCYISEVKTNGRPCLHNDDEEEEDSEEDLEDEEDEEDEFEDEESCVEMRDCECQTRDSLLTQRDSTGGHVPQGLPLTPPPPPTRRPPGLPPLSPPSVPSPPPPPTSHYPRPMSGHYGGSMGPPPPRPPPQSDHYEVDDGEDAYNSQRYRAEAVIEMRDRQGEPSKTGKSTPDVLVTH